MYYDRQDTRALNSQHMQHTEVKYQITCTLLAVKLLGAWWGDSIGGEPPPVNDHNAAVDVTGHCTQAYGGSRGKSFTVEPRYHLLPFLPKPQSRSKFEST